MTTDADGYTLFEWASDASFAPRMTDARRAAVERATGAGYALWFRVVEPRTRLPDLVLPRKVFVEARSGGGRCGTAEFSESREGYFYAQLTTSVEEGHLRRGLADAMYVVAEVVAGRVLFNFWATIGGQSEDGARLWEWPRKSGRVRPFGPQLRPEI